MKRNVKRGLKVLEIAKMEAIKFIKMLIESTKL